MRVMPSLNKLLREWTTPWFVLHLGCYGFGPSCTSSQWFLIDFFSLVRLSPVRTNYYFPIRDQPGVSNSTTTLIPLCLAYSITSAISS